MEAAGAVADDPEVTRTNTTSENVLEIADTWEVRMHISVGNGVGNLPLALDVLNKSIRIGRVVGFPDLRKHLVHVGFQIRRHSRGE